MLDVLLNIATILVFVAEISQIRRIHCNRHKLRDVSLINASVQTVAKVLVIAVSFGVGAYIAAGLDIVLAAFYAYTAYWTRWNVKNNTGLDCWMRFYDVKKRFFNVFTGIGCMCMIFTALWFIMWVMAYFVGNSDFWRFFELFLVFFAATLASFGVSVVLADG